MDLNNVTSPDRDLVDEARALRVQVLNTSLLFAVVVGGLGFARTFIDALELEEWRIVAGSVVLYGGFIALDYGRLYQERCHTLTLSGILLSHERQFEM